MSFPAGNCSFFQKVYSNFSKSAILELECGVFGAVLYAQHQRTDALAKEMGMQINVTRQEVFDAMHTI